MRERLGGGKSGGVRLCHGLQTFSQNAGAKFRVSRCTLSRPTVGAAGRIGPVAHHWRPRVSYAGTYDKAWEDSRDPLPPRDFDRRYFRCAPADQQTATFLLGYEEVQLGGFTPNGYFAFVLPRIVFNVVTRFRAATDERRVPDIHML